MYCGNVANFDNRSQEKKLQILSNGLVNNLGKGGGIMKFVKQSYKKKANFVKGLQKKKKNSKFCQSATKKSGILPND